MEALVQSAVEPTGPPREGQETEVRWDWEVEAAESRGVPCLVHKPCQVGPQNPGWAAGDRQCHRMVRNVF